MWLQMRQLSWGTGVKAGLLVFLSVVVFIRQYDRADIATLYPPPPLKARVCQTNLGSFLWNQTVTPRIRIPTGGDCSSGSLGTKETFTIREVLDSGYFEGLGECRKRVPHYSDKPLPNIALASFPGSGNTWTRHLIEQFSEIYTGSVRCNIVVKTFKAECQHTKWPLTIVIKTHKRSLTNYDGAVLIIRNPYKAIFAEYNRRREGNLGSVGSEVFGGSADWEKSVKRLADGWKRHVGAWLDFKGPLHILLYERLLTDFYEEIYKLASFLDVTVTYGDLWCLNQNREGDWHRKQVLEPIFTSEQRRVVDKNIKDIKVKLKKNNNITLPY